VGKDRALRPGSAINVTCNDTVCDVYVFLYHEPPRSSATNGDIPGALIAEGWTAGSCAPSFGDEMEECGMAAFRKQLDFNETATIRVSPSKPALYLVLAVAPGVKCAASQATDQYSCEKWDTGRASSCKWEGNDCVDDWCPSGVFLAKPQAYCTVPLTPGKCEDTPGWHDDTGYDCSWYEQPDACQYFGHMGRFFGEVANEACCVCREPRQPTRQPSPPPPPPCVDKPGWSDSRANCTWYSELHGKDGPCRAGEGGCSPKRCMLPPESALLTPASAGLTFREACCACKGIAALPAADDLLADPPIDAKKLGV